MDNRLIIIILCVVLAILSIAFLIYFLLRHKREKQLIQSIAYDLTDAKTSTFVKFPLPIAVFKLEDTKIIWANEKFLETCGEDSSKLDAKITDLIPNFTTKWIFEGKNLYPGLLTVNEKKYVIHGSIIRKGGLGDNSSDTSNAYMGITYWVDITEYDNMRIEYLETRPVVIIAVIDNLDELYKNQPDRVRNEILEQSGDKLDAWVKNHNGLIRRYDRDRFICLFEQRELEKMKDEKFSIIDSFHSIENPIGITASLSLGISQDAKTLNEGLAAADVANELALTRGGDQAVIKTKLNYEFFGGDASEGTSSSKVRSRVMSNTFSRLIKESSKVLVMGHKRSDLDSVGAAVGICSLCRKLGVNSYIVTDINKNDAKSLISRMREVNEYRSTFISPQEALLKADGRTLLVVVDTNRPEQVEDPNLLDSCNKVAVIDHHRVAATYITGAALSYIEPYSSSSSELVAELLEALTEKNDILKCEAEALLAGISLDTKNYTTRTGVRTFEASAFLKSIGADTNEVKKFLQFNLDETLEKYKIMQSAELYRNIAIAVSTDEHDKIVSAKAADDLLNISGVEASIVIATNHEGVPYASARSSGEVNVQLIMESVGGGGNRTAAAVQSPDCTLEDLVEKIYRAIDDYMK